MTTFSFDEEQSKKVNVWVNEHRGVCPAPLGSIGGRITYSFTPTSLGTVERVTCACGAELDVTEYEHW